MGIGHLVTGALPGNIMLAVLLNWVVSFALIALTVHYTLRTAHAAHPTTTGQAIR
jgi:hypothetical protein